MTAVDASIETIETTEDSEITSQRRWPRKVAALGVAGLIAAGLGNTERVTDYAYLAQANIEHSFGEAPDPTSFEYLEEYAVGNGLFMDQPTGDYTKIWPHSQALSAFYTISLIPGNEVEYGGKFRFSLQAADSYWEEGTEAALPGYNASVNRTNFGDPERYVDDNLWMGLIHLQAFEATNDVAQLERAGQIFDLAIQEWDTQSGGIFWQVQWPGVENNIRAMVSNAPAVQLATALYRHTGNERYKTKAEEIFVWMLQHKDETVGVFNDHIRSDETYDFSKYTYVQGVAAGAMAEMSQIMPDKYSIEDAVDLAYITLGQMKYGGIMSNPAFDAILFRNLFKISSIYDNPTFTKTVLDDLQTTVDDLPSHPSELLELGGIIQLRAMPLIPADRYHKLF